MALSVNDFTAGTGITASAMNTNFATIENYVNSSPGLAALTGATFSGLLTANGGITATGTTGVATFTASGTATIGGVVDITDTTDASDATGDTGALRCEGGASIAKKLYVGTDLDVDGTTNLDVVDIDGAVNIAADLTFAGAVSGSNSVTRIAYSHSGAATVASNQVNTTPTIFVCTSEPTATSNGDIWIDIS